MEKEFKKLRPTGVFNEQYISVDVIKNIYMWSFCGNILTKHLMQLPRNVQ